MVVTGEHSPHLVPSEALFHHLSEVDRSKYSILKPDCGPSVLEEKVSSNAAVLIHTEKSI